MDAPWNTAAKAFNLEKVLEESASQVPMPLLRPFLPRDVQNDFHSLPA